ncbi:MAG: transposase, partial [Thermoanaerobaculia bacterium]|nr:transposase [Thermoanaerobaculia bacterium]
MVIAGYEVGRPQGALPTAWVVYDWPRFPQFDVGAAPRGRPGGGSSRFDPDRHHRRSIRLGGFDYRRLGTYFVTICVQDRACLFGEVVGEEMVLNEVGALVARSWMALAEWYPGVEIDTFVVMPNHLHGLVVLMEQPALGGEEGRPRGAAPTASVVDGASSEFPVGAA